jgi:hypothetical protein
LQIIPFLADTHVFQHLSDQRIHTHSIVITYLVMTFAMLSAAGKDAVRTLNKTAQDKGRINPARAHYPDGAQVGRILKPGNPGCIGCGIAAPVTEKAQNSGTEIVIH